MARKSRKPRRRRPIRIGNPYGALSTGSPGVWGTAREGEATPFTAPRTTLGGGGSSAGLFSGIDPMLTDAQLRKKALAMIEPILGAQTKAIQQTQQQRGADLNAAYAALTKIAGGQAPVVQGAYQGAADATAAYASGLTGAVSHGQQQAAQQSTDTLQGLGLPQAVTSGFPQGGAAASYAMGGYIPASTLAREGAAFTSAAAQFPTTAAGLGVDAQKSLANQALEQIRALEAQRPGMLAQALDSLREADLQRYSIARTNKLAELEFGADSAEAKAKQTQAQRKEQIAYQKWLAEMGLKQDTLTLKQQKYALDVWKAQNPASARKTKKPKFTAQQVQRYRADAASIAEAAYNGINVPDDPGTVRDESLESAPALSYQEALWEMEKEGIPAYIAVQYLNRVYPPGENGRPLSAAQRRNQEARRNRPPGR